MIFYSREESHESNNTLLLSPVLKILLISENKVGWLLNKYDTKFMAIKIETTDKIP